MVAGLSCMSAGSVGSVGSVVSVGHGDISANNNNRERPSALFTMVGWSAEI